MISPFFRRFSNLERTGPIFPESLEPEGTKTDVLHTILFCSL